MADTASMALDELVGKAQLRDDVDFLREGGRALAQALMEAEVAQQVGAGRYERTAEWTGERSGQASATDTASAGGIRGSAASSCGCRGCATAAISRRCWSPVGGRNGRWSRWCRRPTCKASRHDG